MRGRHFWASAGTTPESFQCDAFLTDYSREAFVRITEAERASQHAKGNRCLIWDTDLTSWPMTDDEIEIARRMFFSGQGTPSDLWSKSRQLESDEGAADGA